VEFTETGRLYVLDPQRLALAVDWRCVEMAADAGGALRALRNAGVQIVYVVTGGGDSDALRQTLTERDLPDGPIVSWDARRGTITGGLPVARKHLPALVLLATDRNDLRSWAEALDMAVVSVAPDWIAVAARVSDAAKALRNADFDATSPADVQAALAQP
ncbi:MAG: hypothetical protein ACOC7R_05335, partial [Planctomycetota bacterium]